MFWLVAVSTCHRPLYDLLWLTVDGATELVGGANGTVALAVLSNSNVYCSSQTLPIHDHACVFLVGIHNVTAVFTVG